MNKAQLLTFSIKVVLYFLGAISVLLTILPFLRLDNWWIRIGEFPRLQIAVACLIVFVSFLFFYKTFAFYDFIFLLLLLVSICYQFYCIFPYTPVYPIQVEQNREAKSEKTIKILISNVFIENKETRKLLDLVKKVDPDIILLAEPDEYWIKNISSLKKEYPHNVEIPLDNAYGMALYSRLELIDTEIKYVVEDNIPSIHTNIRLTSGDIVRLYGIHPRPPVPTESTDSTERDAELVIVGKEIEKLDMPTIIAGDLNDVAWSRTTSLFQKISGMLDPRIGRGFYNSFHADHWLVRFPLDHVFHTNHFRLVDIKRLESIGSDHFPIYISLSLESTAEITQEEPEASNKEEKQANEMIEQAEEKQKEEK
jgi:endonuclease/exonuclease/phosphatase (EEP) superfamily protein YafD